MASGAPTGFPTGSSPAIRSTWISAPARAIAAFARQISFDDGSKFDAPVDYCKVTNLYIHNDSMTWD